MAMETICYCTYVHYALLYWKCVLRFCYKCPIIFISSEDGKKDTTNMFPTIRNMSTERYYVIYCVVDVHTKSVQHVQCIPKSLALILLKNIHKEVYFFTRDIYNIMSQEVLYNGDTKNGILFATCARLKYPSLCKRTP